MYWKALTYDSTIFIFLFFTIITSVPKNSLKLGFKRCPIIWEKFNGSVNSENFIYTATIVF